MILLSKNQAQDNKKIKITAKLRVKAVATVDTVDMEEDTVMDITSKDQ